MSIFLLFFLMSGSWVGRVNLGVWPEPFSWSCSCTRDFVSSKFRAMLQRRDDESECVCFAAVSGCFPLRFIKLVSLFRLAGIPACDNSASNVRGPQKPARQSLKLFRTKRLGLESISGTVSCYIVVKAVGRTIGPSPEDLKRKLFKFMLSKQWCALIEEPPRRFKFL